jgi:hypothetical protein
MSNRVIIVALMALLPQAAVACECIRVELDRAFRFSNDVVIGTVVKIDKASNDYRQAAVYVEVERSWKGEKRGSTISAYSSLSEVDCGRAYRPAVQRRRPAGSVKPV